MAYIEMKQRTFNFAVNVSKVISQLPYTIVSKEYFGQLIRCSSLVGANYRASQRAKSTADFVNKLKIVEEETDESVYFLQLLQALNENHSQLLQPLIDEGTEILKIVVSSLNTVRNKQKQ